MTDWMNRVLKLYSIVGFSVFDSNRVFGPFWSFEPISNFCDPPITIWPEKRFLSLEIEPGVAQMKSGGFKCTAYPFNKNFYEGLGVIAAISHPRYLKVLTD